VKGKVLPASGDRVSLVAHHPDGTKSTGEVQITRARKPIVKIELRPSPVLLSSEIEEAILSADLFLFGPGSLFTSVIPNLLIDGLMDAVNRTGRPRIYIGNIMTQPGETDGFSLSDHLRAIRAHVGAEFPDAVVAQAGEMPREVLEKYRREGSLPVVMDLAGPRSSRTSRSSRPTSTPAGRPSVTIRRSWPGPSTSISWPSRPPGAEGGSVDRHG